MIRRFITLAVCAVFLLPDPAGAQAADKPVRVRVGEHKTFSRVVFDWETKVPYRVERNGERVVIHFKQAATLDLSRYRKDPPPMVESVDARPKAGGLTVDIGVAKGAGLRHFTLGTKVVVDVLTPGAATAKSAKPAAPGTAARPKAQAKAVPKAKPNIQLHAPEAPRTALAGTAGGPPSGLERLYQETPPGTSKAKVRRYRTVSDDPAESDGFTDFVPEVSLGTSVSTLGLGGVAGLRFNDFIGLRLIGNRFALSVNDREYEDVSYDVDVDLWSAGGLLDIYPFGGGLRLTGGLRYNGNNADLDAKSDSSFKIGGRTFTAAEVGDLSGELDFNTVAPYAGLGYEGLLLDGRLSIGFDIGVHYQGDPDVDLDSDGTLANDPTFLAALDREVDDIEDELSLLGFYPVVGLSLKYRF